MKKYILLFCFALSGCAYSNIEGAGFVNNGKDIGPVKCEQIDPLHIRCASVKK